MPLLAKFTYTVAPGRLGELLAKFDEAAQPKFDSPVMPRSVKLYRAEDPGTFVLLLEYENRHAYEERTAFEQNNPAWRALWDETADSPQRLVSRELWEEFHP